MLCQPVDGMQILLEIDALKAQLDRLRPLNVETEGRVMQKLRLDANYHSNHIEGNTLNFGETKALILFGITAQGKPLRDHLEIRNHNEVLHLLEEVVKESRPLTEHFIRELHALLLKEPYEVDAITPEGNPTKKRIQVGAYKTTPNHVLTKTGEVFYFATPEETAARMGDLLRWYEQEKSARTLHPLLLAAAFHYRFVQIHPFDDGNGRLARMLANFIMMQAGFPPVVIPSEEKQHYFAALRQADNGNLEPFYNYLGAQLKTSLTTIIDAAQGLNNSKEADDVAILEEAYVLYGITKPVRARDTVAKVWQKSIVPLLEAFYDDCERFYSFYQTPDWYFYLVDQRLYLQHVEIFERPLRLMLDNFQNCKFAWECRFEGLKTEPGARQSSWLRVWLDGDNYQLPDFDIVKPYNAWLTKAEIEEIVQQLKRSHLEFLAEHRPTPQRIH